MKNRRAKRNPVSVILTTSLIALSGLEARAGELPVELTGCWESVHGETRTVEIWFRPSALQMIGINETRKNGISVNWEYMRFDTSEGELVFHAAPSGQVPTRFEFVERMEDEIVFENPEHDFPSRVIYRIPKEGRLQARIEGVIDETKHEIQFEFKAFDCSRLFVEPNP